MAWVRFIADMDWKPHPMATIAYRSGDVKNVTRRCADVAVSRGKAVRMRKPTKLAVAAHADEGKT